MPDPTATYLALIAGRNPAPADLLRLAVRHATASDLSRLAREQVNLPADVAETIVDRLRDAGLLKSALSNDAFPGVGQLRLDWVRQVWVSQFPSTLLTDPALLTAMVQRTVELGPDHCYQTPLEHLLLNPALPDIDVLSLAGYFDDVLDADTGQVRRGQLAWAFASLTARRPDLASSIIGRLTDPRLIAAVVTAVGNTLTRDAWAQAERVLTDPRPRGFRTATLARLEAPVRFCLAADLAAAVRDCPAAPVTLAPHAEAYLRRVRDTLAQARPAALLLRAGAGEGVTDRLGPAICEELLAHPYTSPQDARRFAADLDDDAVIRAWRRGLPGHIRQGLLFGSAGRPTPEQRRRCRVIHRVDPDGVEDLLLHGADSDGYQNWNVLAEPLTGDAEEDEASLDLIGLLRPQTVATLAWDRLTALLGKSPDVTGQVADVVAGLLTVPDAAEILDGILVGYTGTLADLPAVVAGVAQTPPTPVPGTGATCADGGGRAQ